MKEEAEVLKQLGSGREARRLTELRPNLDGNKLKFKLHPTPCSSPEGKQ